MAGLNPTLIKEIGLHLFKEIDQVMDFPIGLQNFMMSSKEAFTFVLDAFSQAHYVQVNDSYVITHLVVDKQEVSVRLPIKAWYCKPLSLVAASAMKKLHIDSYYFDDIFRMKNAINSDLQTVCVEWNQPTYKIFEVFNNREITKFAFQYYMLRLHEDFLRDMQVFSVPCRVLELSGLTLDMYNGFGDLNNPYLHRVRRLIIKCNNAKKEPTFNEDLRNLAHFIAINFSGLKFLNIAFTITDKNQKVMWDWNDNELPTCLDAIPAYIRGSICFKILNYNVQMDPIPGIQYTFDRGDKYTKEFIIYDNLSLKLILHNYRKNEESIWLRN